MLWFNDLMARKHALKISNSALARLSGVSKPTVDRVAAGRGQRASVANVAKIAEALQMEVRLVPKADADAVLDRRARRIARSIVDAVQGNLGLESQAVDGKEIERMVEQTVHELMAGPKRRLWDANDD